MITCKLWAGLGNQMFMIAAVVAHAARNGTTFGLPAMTVNPKVWKRYFGHIPIGFVPSPLYREEHFHYSPIPPAKQLCLEGYFQSEKYFKDELPAVLKAFRIPPGEEKGVVSIHVRRGDYLKYPDKHPVLPLDYYAEAIRYYKAGGYSTFFLYSDDIPVCKERFKRFTDVSIVYMVNSTEMNDLVGMSHCEHHIIANSTFSWWGAYLNRNPDKIVIAPKTWFGPGNKHLNTKDILPPEWIKL